MELENVLLIDEPYALFLKEDKSFEETLYLAYMQHILGKITDVSEKGKFNEKIRRKFNENYNKKPNSPRKIILDGEEIMYFEDRDELHKAIEWRFREYWGTTRKSLEEIQDTLDELPIKIESEEPIILMVRMYDPSKEEKKKLVYFAFPGFIASSSEVESYSHEDIENIRISYSNGALFERKSSIYQKYDEQIGETRVIIDLSYFTTTKSGSLNALAEKEGYFPIRYDNEHM